MALLKQWLLQHNYPLRGWGIALLALSPESLVVALHGITSAFRDDKLAYCCLKLDWSKKRFSCGLHPRSVRKTNKSNSESLTIACKCRGEQMRTTSLHFLYTEVLWSLMQWQFSRLQMIVWWLISIYSLSYVQTASSWHNFTLFAVVFCSVISYFNVYWTSVAVSHCGTGPPCCPSGAVMHHTSLDWQTSVTSSPWGRDFLPL